MLDLESLTELRKIVAETGNANIAETMTAMTPAPTRDALPVLLNKDLGRRSTKHLKKLAKKGKKDKGVVAENHDQPFIKQAAILS
jgi:hypothetical protein